MRFVYLDNFRGFRDTLIPVLDVNFCVGENSSGKTSFLSAVNLLSSNRFWFEQNFEGTETAFKHFSDYVSANSIDQSYFRMGVAESRTTQKSSSDEPKEDARFFLFKYVENEGMPRLDCCTTNYGSSVITVFFSELSIRYRISPFKKPDSLVDLSSSIFKEWAEIQEDRTLAGTKIIKDSGINQGYVPPLYALSLALREATSESGKNGEKKRTMMFPHPPFGSDAAWIAPIRTKPRRTYDEVRLEFSPEGTHMPYLIKRILGSEKESANFVKFLKRFGKESGLFKEVNVHKFGSSPASPFELEIVLDTKPLNISNVGYGVSQGLPVVVEMFTRPEDTLFAIQQPEVHLHPKAQAAIGEMIFNLAVRDNKKFIVETHSDFTIDRFRVSLRDSNKSLNSQVLFFERKSGKNLVTSIHINENGEMADVQPRKYREFFLKEGLRVIGF